MRRVVVRRDLSVGFMNSERCCGGGSGKIAEMLFGGVTSANAETGGCIDPSLAGTRYKWAFNGIKIAKSIHEPP